MEQAKTVTIRTYMEDSQVVFEVKDEGTGFDPSIMENFGEPYKTTKVNGSGLGLAACKSIAESHHARMDCRSDSTGAAVRVLFDSYLDNCLESDEKRAELVHM
jgi:nitrogen fixation/metabolism regulation signal transduction histidine kinase